MKNVLKKSLAISLSFVGAMIGVGLASGREVVSFYAKYGFVSLLFCVVSGFVFYVLILICMCINSKTINMHKNKNRKSSENCVKYEYVNKIHDKKHIVNRFYNAIMYICQIGICSAMFAGLSSVFDGFGFSFFIKFILLLIVYFSSILILKSGSDTVFSLNSLLSILLILFCFVLLLVRIVLGEFDFLCGRKFSFYAPFKSILYAGMNVLTIYPLLREKSKFVESKKEICLISLFSSIFIVLILIVVCLCVLLFGGCGAGDDMIMLSISSSVSNVLNFFHVCLVLFSIFSTLLSTAYGSCNCLPKFKFSYILNLSLSFALGFVGFSNLIDYLYPILGLLFIVYICVLSSFNGHISSKRDICFIEKKRKNDVSICEKRA